MINQPFQNREEMILYFYRYLIYNFETSINNNPNNNFNSYGYLIDLKDYEYLKSTIDYNSYIKNFSYYDNYNKYFYYNQHLNFNINIFEKKMTIKQIEFKNSHYLLNMLFNGNEYILITHELWKVVCNIEKENERPILYEIRNRQIIITLDDKKPLVFNFNDLKKNVIEKSFLVYDYKDYYNSFYNKIENIYKSIINYYKFEYNFSIKLNKEKCTFEREYLISKKWLDNWKLNVKYEIIKDAFLRKLDVHNIKNIIIYFQELNYKNDEMTQLRIINFKNKDEMEKYLQNDSLVIVNEEFCSSFNLINSYSFNFKIYNYIISIKFGNDILSYKITNNIISQSGKDEFLSYKFNDFIHLNQLLKIYFFQKELKEIINFPHNISKNNKENIYLIGKETISKYKNYFQYDKLFELLNNDKIKNLNYHNYESNFEKIMTVIKEDYINNYQNLQRNLNIQIDLKNYSFNVVQCVNNIKYIKDFEFIDKDIVEFFVKNKIFNKEQFIEGEYIGKEHKIFIIFQYQDYNYYEIGFLGQNVNLQIEYLIKEISKSYKEVIINYFNSQSFESIYKSDFSNKNNILYFHYENIGYFFKIEENNNNILNIENVQNYQNNKFILDVLSFLISLYLFENEIINKIKESSKKTFSNNISSKAYAMDICYLVNKNFIPVLKNMLSYKEIEEIIKSNSFKYNNSSFDENIFHKIQKNNINNILNKKKGFEQFISKNKLQIEKLACKNNSQIIYPNNFYILNNDSYQKLLKICSINQIKNDQFWLCFNSGKIVLRAIEQKNYLNNDNEQKFIDIVSLKQEGKENINYIQEMLLLLFGKDDYVDNTLYKITNDEDIIKSYSFNSISFEKKYNCKGYIINQEFINELYKKENNLNKYLTYIINLHKEYSALNKKINEQNSSSLEEKEYDYYLISKNYINDIESLLNFKDMRIIIENIQSTNSSFDIHDTLRQQIQGEKYNSLINLNEQYIKSNLDRNAYLLSSLNDNNNEPYYYNNCQIVSKVIKDFYKVIDPNIEDRNKINFIKNVKCIFDKRKIIMFLNKKIINLGKLNENNEFNIDYIIKINYNNYVNHYNNIKKNGYNYIENYFINTNKKYIKEIHLDNKVVKLIEESNISEKLQALILIVAQQINLIKNDFLKENNKYQKVFLINKKCLLNYQYQKLCSIIQKDERIKEIIGRYINSKISIDWNAINYNISTSSIESLKEIDLEIKNNNSLFYESEEQCINANKKQFFIPTEFILVDEQICELLKKNFKIQLSNSYDYFKKNDNIIIKLNSKNIILILNIILCTNSYNIKYIFVYNKLKEEDFSEIYSKGIEEYLKEKTIFNENNKNDCISPIFSGNNIIGNCYKYVSDYTNCINYSDYLSNEYLKKVLKLYFFYNNLFEKINKKNNSEEKFYLVNKDLMNNIKKDYNYNEIKKLLKDNGINEDNKDKKILNIIKNQQNNFVNILLGKDNLNNDYNEEVMEPEIFPVEFKINDQKTSILINENFEIVSKDIIELFVGKINENRNNYLDCTLQENKIIICFSQRFGSNFFVSLLGKLNNENTFINEYILIYKESSSQNNHKKEITNGIINFINGLQMNMINNSQPITDENYREIGLIIKYDNNIKGSIINWTIEKNENYNKYNNSNSEQKIKNEEQNNNVRKNNEHINGLNKNEKDSLKNHFEFPPLIGLQNIGATCYMNATLQCFCHIDKFVINFKYNKHIADIANKNNKNLSYSFKSLIEKLWPNNYYDPFFNEKIFAPKEFKEKISKLNPLFEGIAANDAKDLVNFIIMTLHIELNIKPPNPNRKDNIFLDQRNQAIMLNNFIEDFTLNNRSIISDLFYAMNCNITKCANCNIQIFNYQTYFFLVFPLEEVRKFKNNNYQYNFNNNFISNEVNIYDCFEYDRKINLMSGENIMYCNYCKRNSNCYMCTSLVTCPEILIILLNRGHGIEFNIKIDFPENLNLYNYIELKNTGFNYQLIGVITHIGESSMSGHFIAYCKDPISQTLWHKYNDAMVNEVSDFKNEVINFAMPYLLFYQKV